MAIKSKIKTQRDITMQKIKVYFLSLKNFGYLVDILNLKNIFILIGCRYGKYYKNNKTNNQIDCLSNNLLIFQYLFLLVTT